MFVTIDGTDYASFRWGDGEVTLRPILSNWLNKHKVWEGQDRDLVGFFDEDEIKPLHNWGQSDNTWLTFEWNNDRIGRKFKEFFTDWHPTMSYQALVRNTRPMTRIIELEPEIEKWIKDRDLVNGADYCMGPMMDDLYRDPFPILFEFKDSRLATMFKLTWGGDVNL